MFPFEGMLKDVAAVNHYNKSDIYNILIKSKELGLEVIPLVQTFGHMEFVLKHGQFAHLRDSADMPESICPCHQQTMTLIGLYIDQGDLYGALSTGQVWLDLSVRSVSHTY